jgi:hypothetical protein
MPREGGSRFQVGEDSSGQANPPRNGSQWLASYRCLGTTEIVARG